MKYKKRKSDLDELQSSNKQELLVVVYEHRTEIAELKKQVRLLRRQVLKSERIINKDKEVNEQEIK